MSAPGRRSRGEAEGRGVDGLQWLYPWLKYLHVLLAIAAVGFNMSYSVWLARAGRDPGTWPFVLRGIKTLDDRFANPAYGLLLVTGLAMVFVGGLDITRFWLLAALALYLVVMVLGIVGYSPVLRRQVALAEEGQTDTPEFAELGNRGRLLGILLAVIVLVIVFLMVVKPGA
jgi:uncharacterized membrane protein